MAEIRFGKREGQRGGKEYPVAADQYFQRRGGHLVTIVDGHIYLSASKAALRGDGLLGWAETPKDAAGYNYWKSSSTAGADSVFVHTSVDNVYEMPWYGSVGASLTATLIGRGAELICTPLTSANQMARIGKVASPITIVDVDTDNTTVFVRIKPGSKTG